MKDKEFKSYMYDVLWDVADRMFKERNCCDFIKNQCAKDRINKTIEYCCKGCEYLIEHKCSVKSLGCKLEVCVYMENKDVYGRGFLDALKKIKVELYIPGYIRQSKEDAFVEKDKK